MAKMTSIVSRFSDLMYETGDKLLPISDYQELRLCSLEEAIVFIQRHKAFKVDSHIQDKVALAIKQRSDGDDPYNLTVDERAAIGLYTMESQIAQESLFYVLNSTLRCENRSELKPILSYFRLLIGALAKLPSFNGLVYRGVNGNISSNFIKGKRLTWWGFSSCTRSLELLNKEEYLVQNDQRTLFYINCINGKSIENYSYSLPNEEEVLLLPGTEFLVTGKKRVDRNLSIVHLAEISAKNRTSCNTDTNGTVGIVPPEDVDFREETKQKTCGHACNLWATRKCCNCSDVRPYHMSGSYEKYVDGRGFVNEATRNEYYCPTCRFPKDLN